MYCEVNGFRRPAFEVRAPIYKQNQLGRQQGSKSSDLVCRLECECIDGKHHSPLYSACGVALAQRYMLSCKDTDRKAQAELKSETGSTFVTNMMVFLTVREKAEKRNENIAVRFERGKASETAEAD